MIQTFTNGAFTFVGELPDIAKLATKIVAIQQDMSRVQKRGRNEMQKYDFVQEADVVDHSRPLLAQHKLAVLFSGIPGSAQYEHRISRNQNNQVWASLDLCGLILDAETGASVSFSMPGQAVDTGSDKAIYKAITGAKKYATMLALEISTGVDPEGGKDNDPAPRGGRANAPSTPGRSSTREPSTGTAKPAVTLLNRAIELGVARDKASFCQWAKASVPGCEKLTTHISEVSGAMCEAIEQQLNSIEDAGK